MTTDTIKQLGAEFHRAADSLADTMAQLDNARLERLTFLRRCSKDSTARLAALREEVRTLPEQIAKWDAEAARLESQTAEDLLRQALEPARKCDGDHKGPLCADRQCWLRCPDCGQGEHFPAACGAVVLHPQPPGEVIEAPLTQPKPEPFRPGLPPERLRKVWAEWEMVDGVVYVFRGNKYRCAYRPPTEWWDIGAEHTWRASYRPHGKSWSEVEAMADAAEKPAEPKMLDLRELPVGTVCEATGDIRTYLGRCIKPGEVFRIFEPDDGMGDKHPTIIEIEFACSSVPALVPARVVKEPK